MAKNKKQGKSKHNNSGFVFMTKNGHGWNDYWAQADNIRRHEKLKQEKLKKQHGK